jgi:hypothetical protein
VTAKSQRLQLSQKRIESAERFAKQFQEQGCQPVWELPISSVADLKAWLAVGAVEQAAFVGGLSVAWCGYTRRRASTR